VKVTASMGISIAIFYMLRGTRSKNAPTRWKKGGGREGGERNPDLMSIFVKMRRQVFGSQSHR
jgi:hypothetical protein